MLFCLALVALLLYDTVFANGVCSQTYDKAPGKIEVLSLDYHHLGQKRCDYIIHAPRDFSILLNFTDIFGFSSPATRSATKSLVTLLGTSEHEEKKEAAVAAAAFEVHEKDPRRRVLGQEVVSVPVNVADVGAACLPEVQIVEVRERWFALDSGSTSRPVTSDGRREEVMMDRICHLRHNYRAPQVFQSRTHELRLKFRWLPTSESGFSVEFTFHHEPVNCEFSCADTSSCLPTWSMVCDGIVDCADHSDEHDCPPLPVPFPASHPPPPPPMMNLPDGAEDIHVGASSTDDVSSVQIIIIVIAAVLTAGVFTCVVSQRYSMGARPWNERWAAVRPSPHASANTTSVGTSASQYLHHHHHHHHYHHQLHRHHPINHQNPSTVIYVPSGGPVTTTTTTTTTAAVTAEDDLRSMQMQKQHDVALLRERQIRLHSVHTDMELDLPTSIQLPDGEETPYDSMQYVHLRNADQESEVYRECIRPPPNRTIFEGESPPPYHKCPSTGSVGSTSVGSSSSFSSSASSSSSSLTFPRTFYGTAFNNGNESPLVTSTNNEGASQRRGASGGHHAAAAAAAPSPPLPHHLRIARLVSRTASMFNAAASSSASSLFTDSASHVPSRPPPPSDLAAAAAENVLSNADIYKEIVKVHKGSGSGV